MTRVWLLSIALLGMLFVRMTSPDIIPVWSGWWWAWIATTCVTSGCIGWFVRGVIEFRNFSASLDESSRVEQHERRHSE